MRIQPLFQDNRKIGQGVETGSTVDKERLGARDKEIGKPGRIIYLPVMIPGEAAKSDTHTSMKKKVINQTLPSSESSEISEK